MAGTTATLAEARRENDERKLNSLGDKRANPVRLDPDAEFEDGLKCVTN